MTRKADRVLVGKPEGNIPARRGSTMYIRIKTRWEGVHWIRLTQDSEQVALLC